MHPSQENKKQQEVLNGNINKIWLTIFKNIY